MKGAQLAVKVRDTEKKKVTKQQIKYLSYSLKNILYWSLTI